MNITPVIDHKFRLREQCANGKINGVEYNVTKNIDHQAYFVEFEDKKTGKTIYVMFSTPFREMVTEAYEFVYAKKAEKK